jgi:hypothetical protein
MRTVSLSNPEVQKKIAESFIPLKVAIDKGTPKFPLEWPALKHWRIAYTLMGGSQTNGITGCSVISPDLELELGTTGSAFVWELFDSTAYDPVKFSEMLDGSLVNFDRYQSILQEPGLGNFQRRMRLARQKAAINRAKQDQSKFRLPPPGFTADGARELFRLSGDLPN